VDEQEALFPVGWWSDRCLVCNRKLTDPRSRELGIGPVCRRRETSFPPPQRMTTAVVDPNLL
jgi:hypothetical protein